MATGLIMYEKIADPVSAVEKLGTIIAKSRLFGCASPEQGQAMVMMAMSDNLSITEMKRRYHIVGGTDLTMRADYMLADFRRLGGEFTWIDDGSDGQKATIRVKYKTNDRPVTYTIQDAEREGLIKPKSRWEKNPASMLRARAQTTAIRMVCPEVLAGFPADDEMMDFDDVVVGDGRAVQPVDRGGQGPPTQAASPPAEPPIDAEFEVVDEGGDKAHGPQIARITELFTTLGVAADQQLTAIKKRGATDMGDLTVAGANDLIEALELRLQIAMDQAAGPTPEDKDEIRASNAGPCEPGQVEQIKTLMKAIAQEPGWSDISEKVKAKLRKHNLQVLKDLSFDEAKLFIDALGMKNLEAFFGADLQGSQGNG